jgi:hypothetical protein
VQPHVYSQLRDRQADHLTIFDLPAPIDLLEPSLRISGSDVTVSGITIETAPPIGNA